MKTLLFLLVGTAWGQGVYPSQAGELERVVNTCRQLKVTCTVTVNPPVIGYRNGVPIYASGSPITAQVEKPKPAPRKPVFLPRRTVLPVRRSR